MNDIREALEWYAKEAHYKANDKGFCAIREDGGGYAREVLLSASPAPASDARELGPTVDEWRIADAAGYSPEGKVFAQRAGEDWHNAMFWECACWFDGYRAALLARQSKKTGEGV
jgi:hypothetical protein